MNIGYYWNRIDRGTRHMTISSSDESFRDRYYLPLFHYYSGGGR